VTQTVCLVLVQIKRNCTKNLAALPTDLATAVLYCFSLYSTDISSDQHRCRVHQGFVFDSYFAVKPVTWADLLLPWFHFREDC